MGLSKQASAGFTGVDQFHDAIFLDLRTLQEAFNVISRNGTLTTRTGFTRQFTVVSSLLSVPFGHQFVARNGSRFLFVFSNGTAYKLT